MNSGCFGHDDPKLCTAPLAWRPLGCNASGMDKLQAELKCFAATPQLKVAGLAADGIKEYVTVHPDLGSFVQLKTGMVVYANGSVVIELNAFLEPKQSQFELCLANAPDGTSLCTRRSWTDLDLPLLRLPIYCY
jgi:hypothetical protein